MSSVKHPLITTLFALLALGLVGPASASIQNPYVAAAQAQTVTPSDVSNFQANLQTLMTWLSHSAANDPVRQAQLNDLQQRLATLTPEQTAQMAGAYDLAAFNAAVAKFAPVTTLAAGSLKPSAPAAYSPLSTAPAAFSPASPAPQVSTSGLTGPAGLFDPQYGSCATNNGSTVIVSDTETIRALLIATEVAKAAALVADRFCDAEFVVLGEGTNLFACIAALVVDLIEWALETASEQLQFCDGNVVAAQIEAVWQNSILIETDLSKLADDATIKFNDIQNQLTSVGVDIDDHISSLGGSLNTQFGQIHNNLTATNTSLANQINAIDADINNHISAVDVHLTNGIASGDTALNNSITAIGTSINNHLNAVDADLLKRATQIDNEIGALQTLEVRLRIEHALAQSVSIGLFILPVAQGGYLETVRSIVSDTISRLLAAGQAVNGATKWLALGDTALASKLYKSAYQNYVTAYVTAAK